MSEPATHTTDPLPPPAEKSPSAIRSLRDFVGNHWPAILMWALLALILLAISDRLLHACAFGASLTRLHWLNYCSMPASGAEQEIAQIRATIRQKELALIAKAAACRKICAPTPQPPTPRPPRGAETEGDRIRKAARARGGGAGRLQISLSWSTRDDLDLEVTCPGGVIRPFSDATRGPGVCGDGILKPDANRSMQSPVSNPIEHVVWSNPPEGIYEILVRPLMTASTRIAYKVAIKFDDEEKTCTGFVFWDGRQGYGEYPLKFELRHPLPACEHRHAEMSPCGGQPHCTKRD